jgi:hypothetical protein
LGFLTKVGAHPKHKTFNFGGKNVNSFPPSKIIIIIRNNNNNNNNEEVA